MNIPALFENIFSSYNLSNNHAQVIINSMQEGVIIIDKAGKTLYINPAGGKLLGVKESDVAGKVFHEYIAFLQHDKELLLEETPFKKILTQGGGVYYPLEENISIRTFNNSIFPITLTVFALPDISGAVAIFHYAASEKGLREKIKQTVEDWTQELQKQRAKFDASIQSLNIGFIMTDSTGEVLTINSAAKRILFLNDHSPSPGILRSPVSLDIKGTLDDVKRVFADSLDIQSNIEKCIKEAKAIDIKEVSFKNLFLSIFFNPIVVSMPHPHAIGCVILIEDITQDSLLEHSKDEFFSIASHELRTPLTAIRGNASLLKQFYGDKIQDKEVLEMIDDIHSGSIRLIEIVNDFLDTSRIEQGRMTFNKEEFDIISLINDCLKELESVAKEKNLKLELKNPEHELPKVYADKNRVKQILINLIGNSLKFTKEGGVEIYLEQPEGFVKVLVKDTGRGIAELDKKVLFKKFQQAGQSYLIHDSTSGTGLGLYISKLLAEGMGGKVALENSEIGKGSTFSVSVPLYA